MIEDFGQKSCTNTMAAIECSHTNADAVHFLTALCISQIGLDAAKRLVCADGLPGLVDALDASTSFAGMDGIGLERSKAVCDWYVDLKNHDNFHDLLSILELPAVEPAKEAAGNCVGLTFVITGDVHQFKNRDEFKAYVGTNGGKVADSISKKTTYLVNNDVASTSYKNRKAQELGVPIISESEFIAKFGQYSHSELYNNLPGRIRTLPGFPCCPPSSMLAKHPEIWR